MRKIYLDHAASSRLEAQAAETMAAYGREHYANASALYSLASVPRRALKTARERIAALIGAQPGEIFFTSGGSEANNWALKGAAFRRLLSAEPPAGLREGRRGRIIVSAIEHRSVLESCRFLERLGFEAVYLPVDGFGLVSVSELKKHLSEDTFMVSVMLANNEIGSVEPVRELAEAVHEAGPALFHTDAVQALGHIPVDVKELGVDLLSASAHKFNGPKGVGFLFKREGVDLESLISGGAQESGQRAGTENVGGIAAMAEPLAINCARMAASREHMYTLCLRLLERLKAAGLDFILNGPPLEERLPGNISLSFAGVTSEALLHRLDLKGVCVSAGSACQAGSQELSHVLRALPIPQRYVKGTIRLSLGAENTLEEMDYTAECIADIVKSAAER
ncbi:cysteine desulfurase [bacterium]|nr:cysteine desulfurase [bacterium]